MTVLVGVVVAALAGPLVAFMLARSSPCPGRPPSGPSLRTAAFVTAPARIAAPRLPAFPVQRGMTLWAWTADAYARPAATAALVQMAKLGVRDVVLVPTWFQTSDTGSDIFADPASTPSDDSIRAVAARARRLGLQVIIKPQLNLTDGSWRGSISPRNPAQWFASYTGFVLHYARLAATVRAAGLVVGTELYGVSGRTAAWERLISTVEAAYRGPLTYAALPFEYCRISFWSRLSAIGVDAYWPLAHGGNPGVSALESAWQPIRGQLASTASRWRRPVLFTEAGYTSEAGTASDPSSWTVSTTYAPGQQADAYRALLSTFTGQRWFGGVDWWAWRATDDPLALDYTPQDKPAAQVLASYWTAR